jgi:hypothetical protein
MRALQHSQPFQVRARLSSSPADQHDRMKIGEQSDQIFQFTSGFRSFEPGDTPNAIPPGDSVPGYRVLSRQPCFLHETVRRLRRVIVVIPTDEPGAHSSAASRGGGHGTRLFEEEENLRVDATVEWVEIRNLYVRPRAQPCRISGERRNVRNGELVSISRRRRRTSGSRIDRG